MHVMYCRVANSRSHLPYANNRALATCTWPETNTIRPTTSNNISSTSSSNNNSCNKENNSALPTCTSEGCQITAGMRTWLLCVISQCCTLKLWLMLVEFGVQQAHDIILCITPPTHNRMQCLSTHEHYSSIISYFVSMYLGEGVLYLHLLFMHQC